MQQTKHSTKNSVIGIVIASVCIVVYLAALVSAAVQIYGSVDQRRIVAEQEFFDLADLASSAGVLGFMNETFIETIEDTLAASRTLEGVIISGPNGEYAFERERGRAVNWVNNSPRFKSRFDFSRQPLYLPLRIQGLRNVSIQAVAGALDYALLTSILKQSLILVLAALAFAFFTLLMESLIKGRRYNPLGETVESAPAQAKPAGERESPQPSVESEEALPVHEAAEANIFSLQSNICREEYIESRLDSELRRCASVKQDLVFIAMEFKKPTDDSFYSRFAADVVRFFIIRDLIFEKGTMGVSVICPNINLENGFAKAGEFHRRILSKYPGMFKSKTDLCMGLSSRAGRFINAERLIFESGEALERALMDPASPIVAFKSDPEKYRAYMASQSR